MDVSPLVLTIPLLMNTAHNFFLLVCSWYIKWVIWLTPIVNVWQIQICRVSQIIEQNIGVCPSVQHILECHCQLWPCPSSSLAPWWARFKVFDVPSLWCIIIEATALIDWHNHENQAADYHHKSWFLCIIFVYVKKNHNIYIIILHIVLLTYLLDEKSCEYLQYLVDKAWQIWK